MPNDVQDQGKMQNVSKSGGNWNNMTVSDGRGKSGRMGYRAGPESLWGPGEGEEVGSLLCPCPQQTWASQSGAGQGSSAA